MTILRKAAVAISERVLRWASPVCREWAEGQARELAYIESDWRALAWAVGSTRVLLERRGIRAASDQAAQPRSPRMIEISCWIWYFVWELNCVVNIVWARSLWDRMSWCLLGFSVAYGAATSIADWRHERWEPPMSNLEAYWLFGRKELELKLARSHTGRRWFTVFAVMSGIIGWVMHTEGGMHLRHISSAVWIAAGIFFNWTALHDTPAKFERAIERMDQRIVEARIAKARQGQQYRRAHSDHWGRCETIEPESQPQIVLSGRTDQTVARRRR